MPAQRDVTCTGPETGPAAGFDSDSFDFLWADPPGGMAAPARAMEARAATAPASYVSGKGAGGVVSDYNIEVVFKGSWPAALRAAVEQAADQVSTLIRGDLRNVGTIDDLRITCTLPTIDGRGGVLGSAGPTGVRTANDLPYSGEIEFDRADAATLDRAGQFDEVVLHEMLHCVGFGTMWQDMDLLTGSIRSGSLRFTGDNAIAAYEALFPRIAGGDPGAHRGVPVETDGGGGTAGSHWDEARFGDELMTGWLSGGGELTALTVAALEDMGYDTIFDPARPGAAMPQFDDMMLLA